MKQLALILLATALIFATFFSQQEPLPAVAYVDPAKVLGHWHSYAAIPDGKWTQCSWNYTHHLSWDEKSHAMHFLDVCYSIDGRKMMQEGQMASKNSHSLAHFQVSTLQIFGQYLYLTAKKYDVIGLDPSYRWMVVGHPSLKLGWIYSRSPVLPRKELGKIKKILETAGYDSCDFYTYPQHRLELRHQLCEILDQPRRLSQNSWN
jgi:apolipoprotein D and lipocalin family protein